ncbi:MAG: NAD-dependent epimerase/dehydratase family protein [Rhizobiaceae bacterium]|nr:NAD-dependent epimerase/dehydratase family protein [Rhizobiaceae bacterium]MCV0405634.1 NAD-dependent epimerase/dehydratase family protein [Rhizobiaceae bacterium]
MTNRTKPVVLITGAAGGIGSALAAELGSDYRIVGLDMKGKSAEIPLVEVDLSDRASVDAAMKRVSGHYGSRFAAVIHLAAYFDFTGEENPLYEKVNVAGTRHLLEALQPFKVERFIYSGTMLVHRPAQPGERIDETAPIEPKWAYPKSKARAEEAIREHHGSIPYLLLHLAGLYDDESAVPTLAHQIARIYERDMKSRLYAGDVEAGQSFIHSDDMMRLFRLAVERRNDLPPDAVVLAGEEDAVGYAELQDEIGQLVHGAEEWETLSVPKPLAKVGAWIEEKSVPIVPDDFDHGEKPFIRPFMIEMADDHYALDISRARTLLGWEPRRSIRETLPRIVEALKRDPLAWYEAHGITPPDWMETAEDEAGANPETIRRDHEAKFLAEHRSTLWAHMANAALGTWLVLSPATMGYAGTWMGLSDIVAGIALFGFAVASISPRLAMVRWGAAAVGLWLLLAPLVFWTPSAAAYLNGTLVGTLAIGFAAAVRPTPGISPVAEMTGPNVPPGWSYNPSVWLQRAPIILLAFVGLYFSRYLGAYQLGHIDAAWDPFFTGTVAGKNGTEDVVTSSVSEAWPVPDAGLGATIYLLEILTGVIGSQRRWRTMPWMVLAFGILIVPLGTVSVTFIIIQPILIGTWCTLCLIGAAAMVVQIPYSLDELAATGEFLWRRRQQGAPVLKILFTGDTDEGEAGEPEYPFEQPPGRVVAGMLGGGIGMPWTLAASILIGLWLMTTRITLGADGMTANVDHVTGSLAITFSVIALAEIGRAVRYVNILLGAVLVVSPFLTDATATQAVAQIVCGIALVALALPRGPIKKSWGASAVLIR